MAQDFLLRFFYLQNNKTPTMHAIQTAMIVLSVVSGLLITMIVLLQKSSSSGAIISSSTNFAPGAIDTFKHKVVAVLVCIFVVSVIGIGSIGARSHKKEKTSIIDKVAKDVEEKSID